MSALATDPGVGGWDHGKARPSTSTIDRRLSSGFLPQNDPVVADEMVKEARINLAYLQRFAGQMVGCPEGTLLIRELTHIAEQAIGYAVAHFTDPAVAAPSVTAEPPVERPAPSCALRGAGLDELTVVLTLDQAGVLKEAAEYAIVARRKLLERIDGYCADTTLDEAGWPAMRAVAVQQLEEAYAAYRAVTTTVSGWAFGLDEYRGEVA